MNLYLNPNLFFLLKDGELVVWDYKNHVQLELEAPYLARLQQASKGLTVDALLPMDEELCAEGLLSTTPFDEITWAWDDLSRIYHLGVQNVDGGQDLEESVWVQEYVNFCDTLKGSLPDLFHVREGASVTLPPPDPSKLETMSLWQSMQQRKTSRSFDGTPIEVEELSTLLYAAFGRIHGTWDELSAQGLKEFGYRKSSPSGGAMHPVEAYVLVFHVNGLKPGVYHYNVRDHALTVIPGPLSHDLMQQILCGQFFAQGVAVGIFLVGNFERVWQKYPHSRSYRDVFLDAGHVSQTALLSATALGLRTWVTAWFRDTAMAKVLDISGIHHAPLFFLGLGHGTGEAVPEKLRKMVFKATH